MVYVFIVTLLSCATCLSDSLKYYNADHTEISAEEYQKKAEVYKNKYQEAKKIWRSKKADPLLEVIELSGMNKFVDSIPGFIDATLAQRQATSQSTTYDRKIANIIKDSFDLKTATQDMYQYCTENLDQGTIRKVLAWYKTPLARKITAVEREASNPKSQREMIRYISNLDTNPPPPHRALLIEKLVNETKQVETAVNMFSKIIKEFLQSINLTLPEEARASKQEIDNAIDQMLPQLESGMRQEILRASNYVYRDIEDNELEGYIAFLTTSFGQKFNQTATEAMAFVLVRLFEGLGEKIVSSVET
jgi:hypothetical protein